MKARRACGAVCLALSLLSAACGSSDVKGGASGSTTSPGGSAQPSGPKADFKVGFVGTLSGALATLGQAYQAGFENYFKALNAKGGVDGHKIAFIAADDRFDPATGLAAYKNMVQSDKVLVVFGLISSNVATGIQKIADSTKTPIVGTSVIPPTSPYAFIAGVRVDASLTDEVPLLEFLAKERGIKNARIQIVAVDTVSSRASVEPFKELVGKAGMTVIGTRYEPPTVTQFGTQAGEVVANNPDFVVMNTGAAGLGVMSKGLRQAGYNGPIVNYWVGASEQALSQLNDPEIYVFRDYADPSEASAAAMRESGKAQGLSDGLEFSSGNYYTTGYVMAMLTHSILKKCGDGCTTAKFRDLLETDASKIDTGGLTDKAVGFSPDNHQFIHQVRYWKWDSQSKRSVPVKGMESAPAH